MQAGLMNRRVYLQDRVVVNNRVTWPASAQVQVWARITPTTGAEVASGTEGPTNTVTSQIIIRYRTGVRPRMRVLYGSRVLEIMAVLDDQEAHQQLRLLCREVTS